jgi:hypothetical protein
MPAQSVDPRIDEWREESAVEGDPHGCTGEEGEDELDAGHRVAAGLTAWAYPGSQQAWGPGSRR